MTELEIKNAIKQIGMKYDLERVILFGSRARGDNHERSDFDLAAHFKNAQQYFDFQDEIEALPTLLMFDIVDLSSDMISLDLRESISEEGVNIYETI